MLVLVSKTPETLRSGAGMNESLMRVSDVEEKKTLDQDANLQKVLSVSPELYLAMEPGEQPLTDRRTTRAYEHANTRDVPTKTLLQRQSFLTWCNVASMAVLDDREDALGDTGIAPKGLQNFITSTYTYSSALSRSMSNSTDLLHTHATLTVEGTRDAAVARFQKAQPVYLVDLRRPIPTTHRRPNQLH